MQHSSLALCRRLRLSLPLSELKKAFSFSLRERPQSCWFTRISLREIENGMLKWVMQPILLPKVVMTDDQAVKALEATPSDEKQFVMFMNKLIKNLTSELEAKKKETFKKNNEGATKFLPFKLNDFQFLVRDDG
ncbi:hypothetical protein PVK06_037064 [Gossypium arboreum]|uniref:Uncharacterized protein n=1 Tax=Gossypium arboreum TaxID=29729 RepID=A0ABR0MWN7_GOSAR|nr:hypothetical protein PVK06_037064 [Gossypium arboreum]